MKQILAIICMLGALPFSASSQYTNPNTQNTGPKNSIRIGGYFDIGLPNEEFKENIGETFLGGGFNAYFQIPQTLVHLGLEAHFTGIDGQDVQFNTNIGGFFQEYEIRTNSNLAILNAGVRVQPISEGRILPYVDGLIGVKIFSGNVKLYLFDDFENVWELQDTNSTDNDAAFNYGGAVGVAFAPFKNQGILFDLRGAYMGGGEADYFLIDDIVDPNNPFDSFERKTSTTNLILISIGMAIDLKYL